MAGVSVEARTVARLIDLSPKAARVALLDGFISLWSESLASWLSDKELEQIEESIAALSADIALGSNNHAKAKVRG